MHFFKKRSFLILI